MMILTRRSCFKKHQAADCRKEVYMALYFVDYENVGVNGLDGILGLHDGDYVTVFYGQTAKTVPFEKMVEVSRSKATVEFSRTDKVAKNYLDFQLSTYVGYFLGKGETGPVYVISNDNGFDSVVDFWTDHGIEIHRYQTIDGKAPESDLAKTRSRRQKSTSSKTAKSTAAPAQPVQQPVQAAIQNIPESRNNDSRNAAPEKAQNEKPERALPVLLNPEKNNRNDRNRGNGTAARNNEHEARSGRPQENARVPQEQGKAAQESTKPASGSTKPVSESMKPASESMKAADAEKSPQQGKAAEAPSKAAPENGKPAQETVKTTPENSRPAQDHTVNNTSATAGSFSVKVTSVSTVSGRIPAVPAPLGEASKPQQEDKTPVKTADTPAPEAEKPSAPAEKPVSAPEKPQENSKPAEKKNGKKSRKSSSRKQNAEVTEKTEPQAPAAEEVKKPEEAPAKAAVVRETLTIPGVPEQKKEVPAPQEKKEVSAPQEKKESPAPETKSEEKASESPKPSGRKATVSEACRKKVREALKEEKLPANKYSMIYKLMASSQNKQHFHGNLLHSFGQESGKKIYDLLKNIFEENRVKNGEAAG